VIAGFAEFDLSIWLLYQLKRWDLYFSVLVLLEFKEYNGLLIYKCGSDFLINPYVGDNEVSDKSTLCSQ